MLKEKNKKKKSLNASHSCTKLKFHTLKDEVFRGLTLPMWNLKL